MAAYDFTGALEAILVVTNRANKAIEECAPWQLAKTGKHEALATLLWQLAETLRVTTLALWPFIPHATEQMWQRLGYAPPLWQAGAKPLAERIAREPIAAEQPTRAGAPLFPRRETQ